MSVKICSVDKNSVAEKYGIEPNEVLMSINGEEICDVLDYRFYSTECMLMIELSGNKGNRKILIHKSEYEDLGLSFNSYLMDEQRSCKNGCIFCFIDQLPKGLRSSLYFKDDDSRLSFFFGNYITLTNLSEHDVDRIIKMHISPVNVSVHTTNPELRVQMMKNKNAGNSLAALKKFAENGIKLNCQLVLCRDINDGDELERSLNDLSALYPSVESIAVVPVGLTKYRDTLFELKQYDKASAYNTIQIVETFQQEFLETHGTRLVYPADEFFIKAELPMPNAAYYEEFSQLENGVGMSSLFQDEFTNAVDEDETKDITANKSVATGVSAAPILKSLVDYAHEKWHNMNVTIHPIDNEFFGTTVNVAGLISGQDIIKQLKGKQLGDELLIPSVMLRKEGDIFLDSISVDEVAAALNIKISVVPVDGYEFLEYIKK